MTLTAQLQQAILPGRILAVQVGVFRTAVLAETDEGVRCGLAATLVNPDYDQHRGPAVRNAGHLHEMECAELAALVESRSYTEVAVGLAAINALLPMKGQSWVDLHAENYLVDHGQGKNVAFIGHFSFIDRVRPHAQNVWVLELNPKDGDFPAAAAPEIIPRADLVAMTATTLINKTFDDLIALCRPDTRVILLGPSTPLSPILYDYGVNVLSGTIANDPHATLMGIGQGISLHMLRQANYVRLVTMKKA